MQEAINHPLFSNFDSNKKPEIYEEVILTPENKNSFDDKDEDIFKRFERERIEWTESIDNLSQQLREIDGLADLQTRVYSERQKAVEYYHYLMSLLANKNREYRKKYKDRFEFYSYSYDLRIKDDLKASFIANDLSEIFSIKEALENHMKFIDKTIGTVDNIIFGIKHRISIEEYKRRL
jgi:hypothetical protein